MDYTEEFAVWINPYSGSSGYVLKTFNNKEEAQTYAKRHLGIKKHGGRVEQTRISRSIIQLLDPEAKKEYFPHTNRLR